MVGMTADAQSSSEEPMQDLSIANQYREPGKGMVYELKCGDRRLVLRALQSLAPSAQWRFEARLEQMVLLGEWHPTRAAAFRDIRDLWKERSMSLGLAFFDWDQVAEALTRVCALE